MTNWQPTSEQMKWLASFAGLRYEKRRVREIVSGGWRDSEVWVDDKIDPIKDMRSNWISCSMWNPFTNWNHMRLVLEALVEWRKELDIHIRWHFQEHPMAVEVEVEVGEIDKGNQIFVGGQGLAEAILRAALATRKGGE